MGLGTRVTAVGTVAALLLAGCAVRRPSPTVSSSPAARPSPATLAWHRAGLPVPAGPAGTPLPRDLVTCAGRWFLVGGLRDAGGGTRPAAWVSPDGATWSWLPVTGRTFYGRQNVLYAAGCRAGRLAAMGAKNGGAHGNPRTSVWRPDGPGLVEVSAPTDASGAPDSVGLARIAGGPGGWLIAGDGGARASVWDSPAGDAYPEVTALPGTAAGERSRALDAVATASDWLVVGAADPPGRLEPRPMVWRGTGRDWRAVPLGAASGDGGGGAGASGELHRVVLLGDLAVAVGPAESGFRAWRGAAVGGPAAGAADGWTVAGGFGADRVGPGGPPAVRGLCVAAGRLVVATVDGAGYALWLSDDAGVDWRGLVSPTALPGSGADRRVAVVGSGDRVVLAVADGGRSSVWWATATAG